MKDRNGADISIGQLVSVIGHANNWIIIDRINYEVSVDLVLQNAITNEIRFVNILDVQKE